MGSRIQALLVVVFTQILVIAADTNSSDVTALFALKSSWNNLPPNWKGADPCGSNWEGIECNNSQVISMTLAGTGVTGSQFGDLPSLSGLQFLDLSNNKGLRGTLPLTIGNLKNLSVLILVSCGFSGPIPDTIGSLKHLVFLALNSNSFSGQIPPSIGYLSSLTWLDLSDNRLNGSIPVSSVITPGLDMLVQAKHFHLGKNQLSGVIPPQLFSSNMELIHVVFDNNQLTGNIPSTLGSVQTLEVVRLDWNSLSGPVPQNLNNLTNLNELFLSNNNLNGAIPNLTTMNLLNYVDMSNNSFDASDIPPWFSSLPSLVTLLMDRTQLRGKVPVNLFSQPHLQSLVLSNNQLNGTLDIGTGYSNQLTLDLQNNSINDFSQRAGYDMNILLMGNPICGGTGSTERYCKITQQPNTSHLTPSNNCTKVCRSNKIPSPNCKCAYPYIGTLYFIFVNFSNLETSSHLITDLEGSLMSAFKSSQLPIDTISLGDPTIDIGNNLQVKLQVFPLGQDLFNRTGVSHIGTLLNHQRFPLSSSFGPFYFIDESYCCFEGPKTSSNIGIIIGAAVGASVIVVLLLFSGIYAFRQKKRAKRAIAQSNPFASWDPDKSTGGVPQLKGARWFSFEELKKCTNNFSEANGIGSGGYGKVYRGTLADGHLIAIKRAQQGSLQGAVEFKTEIELLSRIHHKNVVGLVGFCYEQGEQILVYEYVPNGTLKDCLSGKSGIHSDWLRRLNIALDSARGLAYLHELANPPIIHRDMKSTNILLDDHLNAKVADFGISKPLVDSERGYVTTQVKGTMGYLDPEYYTTQQLTEKSDVYSFGIVLLELITARPPIEGGKYIVGVVEDAMGKSKGEYDLHTILDRNIRSGSRLGGLERFVDLALRCVETTGSERPSMGKVVREIENIIALAALNPNTESASTTTTFEEEAKEDLYNSYGSDTFENSRGFSHFRFENSGEFSLSHMERR